MRNRSVAIQILLRDRVAPKILAVLEPVYSPLVAGIQICKLAVETP
jgi:hypothetical protein